MLKHIHVKFKNFILKEKWILEGFREERIDLKKERLKKES